MKKALQRLAPTRSLSLSSASSASASAIKKSLKIDGLSMIEDFFIDLDEPHKTWRPGDQITGVVVLDLKKNVVNVNITLTLVGYIKVKPGQTTAAVRNKPSLLFRHTSTIYGFDPNDVHSNELDDDDDENDEPLTGLSRGEHRFPFSMRLPKKNIYTSISFEKGAIAYSLRASINHNSSRTPNPSTASSPASQLSTSTLSQIAPDPKNSIQHCDKDLNIVVPINVAKIPAPQTKYAYLRISDKKLFKTISSTSTINSATTLHSATSDNSNDSSSGTHPPSITSKDQAVVKLAVDLPQSGFLRGELVPLKIKVSHYKPIQSSCGVIVTLIRLCRVDNGPESPIKSFRKDLCQTVAPLYIDPQTLVGEVSTSLRVPADAFPTIVGSEIVTFQYYVEVLANVSNKNLLRSTNGHTPKNNQKFSHSIVFELDQQPDFTTAEEGMINVDNLKRGKNFLGLNTEIVVGTERVHKKKKKQAPSSNGLAHHQSQIDLDEISQSSISPISINGTTTAPEALAPLPPPPPPTDLSEKEQLRLREQALLPSEPDVAPVPTYTYPDTPTYSAPPLIPDDDSDKAELERRRLMDLESEPPEFDYVPEYIHPHAQATSENGAGCASSGSVSHAEQETLTG